MARFLGLGTLFAIALGAVSAAAQPSTSADFASLRAIGETAIRLRLIDPSSAQFEWPYGFVEGTWPTILKSRTFDGYVTCGFVNSKNRMGGYVGRAAFVVVIKNGSAAYADIGTPRGSDFTSRSCLKSGVSLPPAPPLVASTQASATAPDSIADELKKLADLRDRGVISETEFQAQKRKLLRN